MFGRSVAKNLIHQPELDLDAGATSVSTATRRDTRPRHRVLAIVALAGLLVAGTPDSALAASGTNPTDHNTGLVTCTIDTIARTQTLSVKPGAMTSNNFYGTFRTWSWVQYSYDGLNWANWYATATRSDTIKGYGALNPPADTRTFGIGGRSFTVRVVQAYEWYNASAAKIGSTKWLVVDYYIGRVKTPSDPDGYYGETRGNGGCVFG